VKQGEVLKVADLPQFDYRKTGTWGSPPLSLRKPRLASFIPLASVKIARKLANCRCHLGSGWADWNNCRLSYPV